LSTRPLHSGNFSWALVAISATASRQATRAPKSGAATSSQESVETATIALPFPIQRVLCLAVGEVRTPQRPLCVNMTLLCFALALVGLSPYRGITSCLSALSPALSLAQRHRHVVSILCTIVKNSTRVKMH
jgi:hypothetical protein